MSTRIAPGCGRVSLAKGPLHKGRSLLYGRPLPNTNPTPDWVLRHTIQAVLPVAAKSFPDFPGNKSGH